MDLGFFRRATSLFRGGVHEPVPAEETPFVVAGPVIEANEDWLPDELNPEGTRPLYESSVYHSTLEELPTFAARYVSEATQEQLLSLLGSPTKPPVHRRS